MKKRESSINLQHPTAERILVVDDAADMRLTLSNYLTNAGYEVHNAEGGAQALSYVQRWGLPDLVLLDIMMPDLNGFEVAELLHAVGNVPIVFVSVLNDTETKVAGLVQYGDDYITKPVDPDIFVARIRRVLQRHPRRGHSDTEIEVAPTLRANFKGRYVVSQGRVEKLTPSECNILEILYQHRGQIVSRDRLLTQVKSADALFVHIRHLRNKIELDPSKPQYLCTARGQGYYLS